MLLRLIIYSNLTVKQLKEAYRKTIASKCIDEDERKENLSIIEAVLKSKN